MRFLVQPVATFLLTTTTNTNLNLNHQDPPSQKHNRNHNSRLFAADRHSVTTNSQSSSPFQLNVVSDPVVLEKAETDTDTDTDTDTMPPNVAEETNTNAPEFLEEVQEVHEVITRMQDTYEGLAQSAVDRWRTLQEESGIDIDIATVPRHERRRLWVGVAGCPGSGKSTVAEAVAKYINKGKYGGDDVKATVIPMDGYHYSKAQLKDRSLDIKRRGACWTFDAERMVDDMRRAKTADRSTSFQFPTYCRERSDPVEDAVSLDPEHDIVIVEGLYLLLGGLENENDCPEKHANIFGDALSFDEEWNTRSVQSEIARWKPLLELWDETWFVMATAVPCSSTAPAALAMQMNLIEDRLVKRTLHTWTPDKTKFWGGATDLEAAIKRTQFNDLKNAWFVTCCAPHAKVLIENISF